VECEAGAYQVATASLTRDVVVRRWALDEQLTEDADGAGRQLKLVRDHWLAVALLPHLSETGDRSALWLIRRHQRKPEKYGVGGCPQVLGILTTDPIANRTADGKSSSRRTFPLLGAPARAAISRRSLASTMLEQIGQMLTSAFANRLLAAAEEPPTAQ
jgi:hypothetical protein